MNAFDAFPGDFNLCCDEFVLEYHWVSWAINAAWPMIKMKIATDIINVPCAFTFE